MSEHEKITSIVLNSMFRNSGSISDAQYVLQPAMNDVDSFKLKSVTIPLSIPVIDSRNNKLYIREGTNGSLLTATLPSSNYTGIALAPALTSAVNSVLSNTTGSFVYNTGSNTLSYSGPSINFSTNGNLQNMCYYECGLLSRVNSWNTSFTTSNIDVSGVSILNIISNFGTQLLNNKNINVLGSIALEESNLSVSSFIDDSADYIKPNTNSLSEISIKFTDNRFRPISVDQDYQITLNLKSD
ncbi:MAG: hypothetical protein RLZZ540_2428 [Bacteroidota bacterium]|jgi:hypothetical protein